MAWERTHTFDICKLSPFYFYITPLIPFAHHFFVLATCIPWQQGIGFHPPNLMSKKFAFPYIIMSCRALQPYISLLKNSSAVP